MKHQRYQLEKSQAQIAKVNGWQATLEQKEMLLRSRLENPLLKPLKIMKMVTEIQDETTDDTRTQGDSFDNQTHDNLVYSESNHETGEAIRISKVNVTHPKGNRGHKTLRNAVKV